MRKLLVIREESFGSLPHTAPARPGPGLVLNAQPSYLQPFADVMQPQRTRFERVNALRLWPTLPTLGSLSEV